MPAREYFRWQRYWSEEPWGPYRDNRHAALIVRELLRPHVSQGTQIKLSDYIFEHPDIVAEREQRDAAAALFAMAQRSKST